MSSFVLLHGSGQNASSWAGVSSTLRSRGHSVNAPDLPKSAPDWGLPDYADHIARSIVSPKTILVGHSFSGVFLPLVAHRSFNCALLVFLAAVIPEPGKSVREQFGEDPGMFSPDWSAAGPGWFDTSQQRRLAERFLFHDCDEATLSWALNTVELFDTRHLVTEAAPFAGWPGVPTAAIVGNLDRTLSPAWVRKTTRRVLGKDAIEIEAGHCPMVSRADELSGLFERLAASVSE